MQNKTDQELMGLVLSKNRHALEELYDRFARLVYSFAFKSTGDEQSAREIVQLVFTRLWTTRKGYDPQKGQFVSWLLTITRNITVDQLRKARKFRNEVPMEDSGENRPEAVEEYTPEHAAVHSLLREQIRAAYRYLSESQIRLIELFYWQGYPLSEIAAMSSEPLGTVKSRLHQALKILRKHMIREREKED